MTWLGSSVVIVVLMVVWRMKRPPDEKMDPPGNFTMFFSPIQGEGDLFIGGVLVIYFMYRVFLESFQKFQVYILNFEGLLDLRYLKLQLHFLLLYMHNCLKF